MNDSYIFAIISLFFYDVFVICTTLLQTLNKTLYTNDVKDDLLLHDNAQPHTGLRTRETVAKL
jgi:hypothetical protein